MAVKATGTGPSVLRTFTFPDTDASILTSTAAVLPYVIGDLLYASGTTALSKLAGVATGRVLVSGGVGVAPAWSASPTLTNLTLPATTSAVLGVLFKGAQPFLHNYADPTSDGLNTFLGLDAGNFTMARVGITAQASYNTGVGRAVLQALTIGFSNDAFGESALKATTTGVHNAGFGTGSLVANTTGSFNSALGSNALWSNLGGDNNTGVGMGAGYTETPANANVSGSQNTFLGTEAGPGSTAQLSNAIHIGYRAHGILSNEVVLGNSSITLTTLRGAVSGPTSLAVGATPATTGALRLTNNTYAYSRNAANSADRVLIGLGNDDVIYLQDKVGGAVAPYDTSVDLGLVAYRWRTGYFNFSLVNTGYYEGTEMTAPSAGAVNTGRLYFDDNGGGKTRLMVLFNTGAAQQVAIQP